jgi:uncharacterized protein YbcC (UPF0753/DUF2309 family)
MIHDVTEKRPELTNEQATAIKQACSLVAPNWPLDRLIAVNALWEFRDHPIESVSARLAALADIKTTMTSEYFIASYKAGKISESSLITAAREYKSESDVDELIASLNQSGPNVWLSIAEIADLNRDYHKMQWQDEITHQISQFCGEFISHNPDNNEDFYSTWLDFTRHDYGMSLLMSEKNLRQSFNHLPDNTKGLFLELIKELDLTPYQLEIYSQKLLLSINGWASYFSWQRWDSRLKNQDSHCLENLLAIRMAWDLIVWRQLKSKDEDKDFASLKTQWIHQKFEINDLIEGHNSHLRNFWIWTYAAELDYQKKLHQTLKYEPLSSAESTTLQAVFCIDVRSERIRRALELQSPKIKTIGFAGFYGLPISYQPNKTDLKRPQLPGLIAPTITVSEHFPNNEKLNNLNKLNHWKGWANSSLSAFTMVETVGWAYAFKLIQDNFFSKKKEKLIDEFSHHHEWLLESNGVALTLDEKMAITTSILNGMGLTRNFAPIVLLLGHSSETRNNLHASGLDCGACGGQSGEVNVRVLVYLLNDQELRQKLAQSGIYIPDKTRFIGGLHNTTTDQISCFEPLNDVEVETWLQEASIMTRRERSSAIDRTLTSLADGALEKALLYMAKDWSEVRPEWGLANNASFIVAPREKTRAIDLGGRSFLHDYNWRDDPEFGLLEQIMTAPMIVTHWINMQYNLSVTDNSFFGSGNKLLHNAVGQHIGVFEGNGGDLRIGLPFQSVHDGAEWRHEPLRLSVYITAPREAIENIIKSHKTVRDLLHNNWLFLFRWSENVIERYRPEYWEAVS